jgi:Uma2 family endonuclease
MRAQEEPAKYGNAPSAAIDAHRVVLHNVSWDTFEKLLQETGDSRPGKRFAYCDGDLEIMSPLARHEGFNDLFKHFVLILAEETSTRIKSAGSLTCKLEAIKKGLEPDSCFYIQHFDDIIGLKDIDMARHPPPDVAIEVDITNSSMNKFPIYEGLKVPEIWRYDGTKLRLYHLMKNGKYAEQPSSLAFPTLRFADKMAEILARSAEMDDVQAVAEFRAWVRQNIGK